MADVNNSTTVQPLYAGQHIEVGSLIVSNDTEYIYINYELIDDWTILETHLEVANSTDNIPVTDSGNPIPGLFTYKNESFPEGTATVGYVIPIEQYMPLENHTLYITANAVISKGTIQEGAWVTGIAFSNSTWAGYFTYIVPHSNEDEGTGDEALVPETDSSRGSVGVIGYSTEPEQATNNNGVFRALDMEEDIEPHMSVPEPVYEIVKQEIAMPFTNVVNILWYIIWILLAAISTMSIYGYRQP